MLLTQFQVTDLEDYNQKDLNYAPTLIQDKEECKTHYVDHPGMAEVIDTFMICTFEKGNINTAGDTIVKSPPTAQGCAEPGARKDEGETLKGHIHNEMVSNIIRKYN